MNTKAPRVGRPAYNLIWPAGLFTIHQLHALNRRKIKWELSARQHIERMLEKRYVSKAKETVQTGKVGKPAHLFRLTKWGEKKLTVKNPTPRTETVVQDPPAVEAPVVATPAPVEIPLTETPVAIDAAPAETPVAVSEPVIQAS